MERKEQRPKRRNRRPRDPSDSREPERAPCPESPEKTPYRSPKAAEIAMLKAQDLALPGQEVPRRAYECPGCFCWHLSKHPEWREPGEKEDG